MKKAKNKREKLIKKINFAKKLICLLFAMVEKRHPRVSLVYVVFRRKKIIWHLSHDHKRAFVDNLKAY